MMIIYSAFLRRPISLLYYLQSACTTLQGQPIYELYPFAQKWIVTRDSYVVDVVVIITTIILNYLNQQKNSESSLVRQTGTQKMQTITKQTIQITESSNSNSEYEDNNLKANMSEEILDQLLKRNKKMPINETLKNEIEDFQQMSDVVKQTSTQRTIVINKLCDKFTYSGEVVNDLMHGKGQAIYHDDGRIYQGQWEFGVKCGKGRAYLLNELNYEGDWEDDQPNGRGLYKYANGDIYEGDFKDDERDGRGLYKFASGAIYVGDFKDNERDGRGLCKYASGAIYVGDYKDDQPNGRGLYIYADGNIYEGDYKDGQPNGRGLCKYADGDIYEGDWKDGERTDRELDKYPNEDMLN